MKSILLALIILLPTLIYSQVSAVDSATNEPLNAINNVIKGNSSKNITVGAYGEIHYNQQLGNENIHTGSMDVHRLVTFMGYRFSDKTQFVSEIEFEHVSEVYIEQAFLNYNIRNGMSFRAGLMLVPMGIINEYHEPVTFNGVERPGVEGKIIPTTWREIGAGLSGNIADYSLKYQAYVFNGFKSYSGDALTGAGTLRGTDGLRKGRQKAAESTISSPNLSAKIDYYGIQGLKLGWAGYFGKSQSELYDGIIKTDDQAISVADSSVIGVSMTAADFRYNLNGFTARGLLVYSKHNNTDQYNSLTGSDLGESMLGYYLEAGYDLVKIISPESSQQCVAFVRYESYDTHHSVTDETVRNREFDRTDIFAGFTYLLAPGAAFKMDFQLSKDAVSTTYSKGLNFGIGIWF